MGSISTGSLNITLNVVAVPSQLKPVSFCPSVIRLSLSKICRTQNSLFIKTQLTRYTQSSAKETIFLSGVWENCLCPKSCITYSAVYSVILTLRWISILPPRQPAHHLESACLPCLVFLHLPIHRLTRSRRCLLLLHPLPRTASATSRQ